ncbi:hypothetical protein Tco_0756350 [Tanacetum coccineum]
MSDERPEPVKQIIEVPVPATFHEQTDDELTAAEIKQMEADDQAIQTILLGLPEDIYAAVDSCETAPEICYVMPTNDERQYAEQKFGYQNGNNAVKNGLNQLFQKKCSSESMAKLVFHNIGNGKFVAATLMVIRLGINGNQIRSYNKQRIGHLASELAHQTKEKRCCSTPDSVV